MVFNILPQRGFVITFMLLIALVLTSCEEDSFLTNNDPCIAGLNGDCTDPDPIPVPDPVPTPRVPSRFYYLFKERGAGKENIRFAYNRNSSSNLMNWFGGNRIISSAETDRGVAATYHDRKLFSFHKGANSNGIFYSYTTNGGLWRGDRSIGAARTKSAPTAVSFRGRMYVYSVGENSKKIWVTQSNDSGFSWGSHRAVRAAGRNIEALSNKQDVLASCVFNNQIVLAVRRRVVFTNYISDGVSIYTSNDGFNFSLSGSFATGAVDKGIGMTAFRNRLYVAYTNKTNNHIRMRSSSNLRNFDLRTVTVNGSVAKSDEAPSLATDGNKLVMVYEEDNGSRIYYSTTTNGTAWVGNIPAKGETSNGGPSIVYVP